MYAFLSSVEHIKEGQTIVLDPIVFHCIVENPTKCILLCSTEGNVTDI